MTKNAVGGPTDVSSGGPVKSRRRAPKIPVAKKVQKPVKYLHLSIDDVVAGKVPLL